MSKVTNLTSKINKDAEETRDSIIAEANAKKAKILEKKSNAGKILESEMMEKAKREAVMRKERAISSAQLQARNEKLKAKQVIIKEVFESSIEELSKLEKSEYLKFIKESIVTLKIDGDEDLILNEDGLKIFDSSALDEINKELIAKGKKGELTLSSEKGNFKGGFVLHKGGIQINNTFEALVNSLKEELEVQVAKELFD